MDPPKKPLHPLLAIGIVLIPIVVLEVIPNPFATIPNTVLFWLFTRFGLWVLLPGCILRIVLMIPGWIFMSRWRKRYDRYQRWKNNHCIECNYDLRAHHPGDDCPECGTPIPANTAIMDKQRSSP